MKNQKTRNHVNFIILQDAWGSSHFEKKKA